MKSASEESRLQSPPHPPYYKSHHQKEASPRLQYILYTEDAVSPASSAFYLYPNSSFFVLRARAPKKV